MPATALAENEKKRHRHPISRPTATKPAISASGKPENDERDQETHRPCSQEGECIVRSPGLWVRHSSFEMVYPSDYMEQYEKFYSGSG